MKIAFVTSQSDTGSTLIGRIFPLAEVFAMQHEVHVCGLNEPTTTLPARLTWHTTGTLPFQRNASGKIRKRGVQLVLNMLRASLKAASVLWQIRPDIIIMSKALPQPVAATWLYRLLCLLTRRPIPIIFFDIDDFELTANHLTSMWQRGAIHWAERQGSTLADKIVTATPFLQDHFTFITAHKKKVALIPTGLTMTQRLPATAFSTAPQLLYIGSLSVSSGHRIDLLPTILAALINQFPAVHLTIAGDGDDDAALQTAFETQNISQRVSWHGRFDRKQVAALLTPHTIILDPVDATTTQRAKSSYRVALAMAMGVPVVTSNIGIRPLLIPASMHNRFFAAPSDSANYAKVIANLIQHPLTATEREKLIQHAAQFQWKILAANYLTVESND